MNILVLNGSPRGNNSNTMKITKVFLDGINFKNSYCIEIINLIESKILPCRGCFSCWRKTPGKCIIDDDMTILREKYINADIIIWSFPLYYFGMPSHAKAFLDRLLPFNRPQINRENDGSNSHSLRYDFSNKKYILISTCGFGTIEKNYEALINQFDRIYNYDYTKIICPQGELFNQPYLEERKNEYLGFVRTAGNEFAENNKISEEINKKISERLYPEEEFIEMANLYWESEDEESEINLSNINSRKEDNSKINQENDESYNFMKYMKNGYNINAYKKDIVLEMYFTDINKTYQLLLTKEKCILKTEDFLPYTTRIESTFELWKNISNGKVNGAEALIKRKYKVKGKFSILMKMDEYFG